MTTKTSKKTGATKKAAARHLDVSVRHLNRLIADQVLPPMPPEGFNLDQIRPLFIRHLRQVAAGRSDGLAEARTQLARLQAERELQVKIMRHRFVDQEEIARQLEGQYALVNDKLHCVAPLAAARIGGDEQQRRQHCEAINAEVCAALAELRKPADITLAALAAQEGQA
jgi:terminase small subunit / prophage DNA-packing protein